MMMLTYDIVTFEIFNLTLTSQHELLFRAQVTNSHAERLNNINKECDSYQIDVEGNVPTSEELSINTDHP